MTISSKVSLATVAWKHAESWILWRERFAKIYIVNPMINHVLINTHRHLYNYCNHIFGKHILRDSTFNTLVNLWESSGKKAWTTKKTKKIIIRRKKVLKFANFNFSVFQLRLRLRKIRIYQQQQKIPPFQKKNQEMTNPPFIVSEIERKKVSWL